MTTTGVQWRLRNAELRLLLAFRACNVLRMIGLSVDRGLTGGVCMTLRNQPIGIWRFEVGRFRYTPHASDPAECLSGDVEDAVRQTFKLIGAPVDYVVEPTSSARVLH